MVFDVALDGAVIVRHAPDPFGPTGRSPSIPQGERSAVQGERSAPFGLKYRSPPPAHSVHHFICTVPFTVTVTVPLPGSTASASSPVADIALARENVAIGRIGPTSLLCTLTSRTA